MFMNQLGIEACQERFKDLQCEVERVRLAAQAQTGRERRDRFYFGALAWLGHKLVVLGRRLQERYRAEPCPGGAACTSQPVSH